MVRVPGFANAPRALEDVYGARGLLGACCLAGRGDGERQAAPCLGVRGRHSRNHAPPAEMPSSSGGFGSQPAGRAPSDVGDVRVTSPTVRRLVDLRLTPSSPAISSAARTSVLPSP